MKFRDRVMRLGTPLFIEEPGRRRRFADLRAAFVATAPQIEARILNAQAPQSEKTIRHIIGMERWGQNRLRVALGSTLAMDEHYPYKPPKGLGTEALLQEFRQTRAQTLELIEKLEAAAYPEKIPHNALGPLSVKAWLYYLSIHAELESRRLR